MREIKHELEHFRQTGVFGAYETRELEKTENNDYKFEDTEVVKYDDSIIAKRCMDVHGTNFRVSSIFGAKHNQTPTKKLLEIMK